MINKLLTAFSFALLGTFGLAQAGSITVAIGTGPTHLVDPDQAAFYVVETATPTGGAYTIFNNTTDYQLVAFGVTNPNTASVAVIGGSSSAGYVTYSNGEGNPFWGALNLSPDNWNEPILRAGHDSSAQDLFGNIGTALGSDGYANYYQVVDANPLYDPLGVSAQGFGFVNGPITSSLFGVAFDSTGGLFTFYAAPVMAAAVPEPETYAMLLAGLGLLGLASRRRKQKEAAA